MSATSEIAGTEICRGHVLDEWIDINDHMNVAYYVLAFDLAIDALWERFGITADYIREGGGSTFAVESHVTWQRELKRGESYFVTSQILAFDEKRIHQFLRMYHGAHRYIAATAEWMNLHVDLGERRVSPWPPHILEGIRGVVDDQGDWPYPAEAGRRMTVRKPLFSIPRSYDD